MFRFARTHVVAALAGFLALAGTVRAETPPVAAGKPIDVVICLDTSNSMDGLIASAKAKLWDIINELARIKPAPSLRVSLYSYGNDNYDPKGGWVRKEAELITDLDELYQKLTALSTRGGTEYVGRVCRDALDGVKWSADKDALKIMFVCGNEPAAQDPLVKLPAVADMARAKGVVINPIFCGDPNSAEARDWKQFAGHTGGKFASINQERGAVAVNAPQDKQLEELGKKLNATYVAYGRQAKEKQANQLRQDENALQAGQSVAAGRAVSKSTVLYCNSDWCLVDRVMREKDFDIKKVPVEELSEELRKMTPEQREAFVLKKKAEREALQKQIQEVSVKRQTYIDDYLKKNPTSADRVFDEAVRGALREQAQAKGITIPK